MKYRDYQVRTITAQDAFMADPDAMRGTVLAATGAGKTECFIDLINKTLTNIPEARILVVHPRIALSQNQQKRFKSKFPVEFTSFHSGHQSIHTLEDRKNVNTTNPEELLEIQEASVGGHITFSSYMSLEKIAHLEFDIIICDEAHYLVQENLRKNLHLFQSKVLFYTGTPVKVAARDESMDNVELFGDIIADVPPSELIPKGYVVPPRLRTLNVVNQKSGNTYDYPVIIAHAFKDQLSLANSKFNHKMLVAMPSTQAFDEIAQELNQIRNIVGNTNVDLYYVTGERVNKNGHPFNGDREQMLEDFGANPNPSIIIHCDTLAEGIDVDGLGGVLIMRGLTMSKAIQTIGRGCRPAKADVKSNGEIRKNRIKTECIVTICRVDDEWVGNIKIDEWAQMFRDAGYGELWDYYEREANDRGLPGEIQEQDDPLFDIIEDIRVTDGVERMFIELDRELRI